MSETLQISTTFIDYAIDIAKAAIIISLFYRIIKYNVNIEMDEIFINTFKLLGYSSLAIYIYLNVNGKSSIDVLTYFTFLLAVIEASHNFMLTVGLVIAFTIRTIWDSIFKFPRL